MPAQSAPATHGSRSWPKSTRAGRRARRRIERLVIGGRVRRGRTALEGIGVARPFAAGVAGLAGQEGEAVTGVDGHRLVSEGVARRRDDADAGRDLVIAGDLADRRARVVDPLDDRVIRCVGELPLRRLDEGRDPREDIVLPGMIGMEVAVEQARDRQSIRTSTDASASRIRRARTS